MLPPPLNIFMIIMFLLMKVFIWICNVTVFLIPKKVIHNWWYAHSDLVTNYAIGVCSSISSLVISIIMLPMCAVVESFGFLLQIILNGVAYISNNLTVSPSLLLPKPVLALLEQDSNYSSFVFSCFCLLGFVFQSIGIIFLLCLSPCIFIVVLVFLVFYFVIVLIIDIFAKLKEDMTFLNYEFIISSFFLTKEGRDIWDIQGPKILNEFKKEKITNISDINTLTRIQWYYENFLPVQSLRLIFDEYEFGFGEIFLLKMIKELKLGVEGISEREKKKI